MRTSKGQGAGFRVPGDDARQGGKIGQNLTQGTARLADDDDPIRLGQAGQGLGEGDGIEVCGH